MRFKRALLIGLFCGSVLVIHDPAAAKDRIAATEAEAQKSDADPSASPPGNEARSVGGVDDIKADDAKPPAPTTLSPLRTETTRSYYRSLIEKEAAGTGLSPEIADSVMEVESGYNPAAVGSSGEIGLMQVMPSTARMMGFAQPLSALAEPEQNIHYGVTYLARAWRLAGGDLCTAVMKYRAGHGETRFSSLSVDYCLAVRAKLKMRGVAVVGTVPAADFVSGGPQHIRFSTDRCRHSCIGGGSSDRVDFASLNARLTAIVVQARPDHE